MKYSQDFLFSPIFTKSQSKTDLLLGVQPLFPIQISILSKNFKSLIQNSFNFFSHHHFQKITRILSSHFTFLASSPKLSTCIQQHPRLLAPPPETPIFFPPLFLFLTLSINQTNIKNGRWYVLRLGALSHLLTTDWSVCFHFPYSPHLHVS